MLLVFVKKTREVFSGKRDTNLTPVFKITILFFLSMMTFMSSSLSQTQSERVVYLKIAVDHDLKSQDALQLEVRRLMLDSCRNFKKHFGIVIKIQEFVYWKPESHLDSMKCYLNDLRSKIQQRKCDIVLGIILKSRIEDITSGIASYHQRYIILKSLRSKEAMAAILTHELCHMFGAVDIIEKDSIMCIKSRGCEFDKFTKRIILLNKYREFDPHSYPLSKDRMEKVIALYKQRAELNLGEPELHLVLASLYLEKQKFASALVQCQKALETNPELKDIHILIGNIHLQNGEIDKALHAYKKALYFQPRIPEIHFNLGLAYTRAEILDEAISAYKKTIELNPFYCDAYANLGYLYIKKGDLDLAVTSSKKALDLVPNYPEPHIILGVALACLGDAKNAEKEFQEAIALRPNYLVAHYNLGVLHLKNHSLQASAAHFSRTVEIDARFGPGYQKLAEVFYALSLDCRQESEKRGLKIENELRSGFLFYTSKQNN